MTKDHIISEIRRLASESNGVPPGQKRISSESGIHETDWRGRYWARWGDALQEAGFQANEWTSAIPRDELLVSLAGLVRELGRFPVKSEIQLKSRVEPGFPSHNAFFRRLGGKQALAAKLREYLIEQGDHELAKLCNSTEKPIKEEQVSKIVIKSEIEVGFVYLMKSGRYHKIGRTDEVGRRQKEIGIQLPEKLKLIHSIKTDDPSGIEAYWHNRFKAQRKNGEWFELTAQDVTAFKRRKFM